jgi:Fe-S-cluster-containing hydrogenase component 2
VGERLKIGKQIEENWQSKKESSILDDIAQNLSRRKFMTASGAAIAAPLVMNMAAGTAVAQAAEKSAATAQKTYYVNDTCCLCPPLRCKMNCPAGAVNFDGEKMAIDSTKCIRCGTCYNNCPLGAIIDSSAPVTGVEPHPIVYKDCDFLIIGGGMSGIVAAAAAADLSKKKVIVLEKGVKAGGCGYFPIGVGLSAQGQNGGGPGGGGGGMSAPTETGVDDSVRNLMSSADQMLNPKLIANFKGAKPGLKEWFFSFTTAEESLSNTEKERSARFILKVIEHAKQSGVEILLRHSATEFIMADNGQIAAVKAQDPGGTTIINCKHCLVATGSVVNNVQILERALPQFVNAFTRRTAHRFPYNSGDGVIMAEKAGIPIDYSAIFVHFTGINSSLAEQTTRILDQKADSLIINLHGERWVSETGLTDDYLPLMLKQPRCTFYHIMDSKIIQSGVTKVGGSGPMGGGGGQGGPGGGGMTGGAAGMAAGGQGGPGGGQGGGQGGPGGQGGAQGGAQAQQGGAPGGAVAGAVAGAQAGGNGMESTDGITFSQSKTKGLADFSYAPSQDKPDMKEIERIAALPGRHIVKANTLEELGEKLGIDKATFMATIKRYNELCAKGHDDDFYKDKKYMTPIQKGPFYASSHILGHDGAFGGLHINEFMEVIGKNGPISNLYASGDITSDNTTHRGSKRAGGIEAEAGWAVTSGFYVAQIVSKKLKA